MSQALDELVSSLPEVYQTIYGHPELSEGVSRTCFDRLDEIVIIYRNLEKKLGRPPRVLDLGCAQGFFCLNLAALGATAHGIDFLDKNIDVCNALANENPELKVKFTQGKIEDIISSLNDDEYDLVTGLSVFHHIVHMHGLSTVKEWISILAEKTKVSIFELALDNEPLYWAKSQPSDPKELLSGFAFVHEIGFFGTHLSEITRPLYVASNYFWVLDNSINEFHHWSNESHQYSNNIYKGTRRYFFGEKIIAKVFQLKDGLKSRNAEELDREANFLTHAPKGFSTPNLITYGSNDNESWLAMDVIPGELLLDVITSKKHYDAHEVLLSTLRELDVLEKEGIYHEDLRTWNVLLQPNNQVKLIDFGSITKIKKDCVWPTNIYFSFFIYLKEVVNREIKGIDPLRQISISPFSLPVPYDSLLFPLWNTPLDKWSFSEILKSLEKFDSKKIYSAINEPKFKWISVIEQGIQTTVEHSQYLANTVEYLEKKISLLNEFIENNQHDNLESKIDKAIAKTISKMEQEYVAKFEAERARLSEHFNKNINSIISNKAEILENDLTQKVETEHQATANKFKEQIESNISSRLITFEEEIIARRDNTIKELKEKIELTIGHNVNLLKNDRTVEREFLVKTFDDKIGSLVADTFEKFERERELEVKEHHSEIKNQLIDELNKFKSLYENSLIIIENHKNDEINRFKAQQQDSLIMIENHKNDEINRIKEQHQESLIIIENIKDEEIKNFKSLYEDALNIIEKDKHDIYLLNEKNAEYKVRISHLEWLLDCVYRSRSWKISAPVRGVGRVLRSLNPFTFLAKVKRRSKASILRVGRSSFVYLNTSPKLKRFVLIIINKLGLHNRLKSYYYQHQSQHVAVATAAYVDEKKSDSLDAGEVTNLSSQAKKIYDFIEKRKNDNNIK